MAGSWSESRAITDKCWAIVRADRTLALFPVMSLVVGGIALLVFGAIGVALIASDATVAGWIVLIVGLFVMQACLTLVAAGLVSAADTVLAGGDATVRAAFRAASGHLGALLRWSVIQSIMAVLIGLLRGNGNGGAAQLILRNVVAAAAGLAWDVITLFVLPFIVLGNHGTIDAIKASAGVVRKHWGTQIAGGVRIGGRLALYFFLPAIACFVAAGFTLNISGGIAGVLIILGIGLFVIGGMLGSLLRAVFSVALYHYVQDGEVLASFTEGELQGAVRVRAA